jgi:ketosteroid isomerase-like protein
VTNRQVETHTHDEILALEAKIDGARVRKDLSVFERVLAEGFQTTSPVGARAGKAEMLEDVKAGTFDVKSSRSGDLTVLDLGDTAIVFGTAILKARYSGHDISGAYAYTHVYKRSERGWQVVAAQSSRKMPDWLYGTIARLSNLFRIRRK